jgi:hypothetical protein
MLHACPVKTAAAVPMQTVSENGKEGATENADKLPAAGDTACARACRCARQGQFVGANMN